MANDGLNLDGTNLLIIDGSSDPLIIDGGGAVIKTTLQPITQTLDATEIEKVAITTTLRGPGSAATPPSFDATFGNVNASGWVNGLSTTIGTNIAKTGGANRVMVMSISYEYTGTGSGHVTGISDSLGALTWSHYCTINNPTSGAHNQTIEIWIAPAAAVYNPTGGGFVETISWTGSNVDDASVTMFAVAGCHSIAAPFDVNSPAFGIVTSSTAPPTVDFDALQGGALVVAVTALSTGFPTWVAPSGWTNFDQAGTSAGINDQSVTIDYLSATDPQSGAYHNEASLSSPAYTTAVLAFTGGPPLAPISQILDVTTGGSVPAGVIKTTLPTLAQIIHIEQGSIFLDSHSLGGANGPTDTASVTISTNHDDDVIVLTILTGGFFATAPVHTVTDDAGLVWRLRHRRRISTGAGYAELWWAHAPTPLSADTITVDTAGTTGAITIEALAIAGANYLTPWDTNMQAGWFTDNWKGGDPTSYIVTDADEAFLLAFYISSEIADNGTIEPPFTYLQTGSFSEHVGNTNYVSTAYYIAAEPQTGLVTHFDRAPLVGDAPFRGMLCDALVAAGRHGTDAQTGEWWFDGVGTNDVLVFRPNGGGSYGPPVFDASNSSFTTFYPDIQIVVAVLLDSASNAGEVTNIDAFSLVGTNFNTPTGLVFQRRSRVVRDNLAFEIWWALSSTDLDTCYLQITTANMAYDDTVSFQVYPVAGSSAFQNGPAWDIDRHLPSSTSSDTFGQPTVQIETVLDKTLDLMFAVNLDDPLDVTFAPFSMTLPIVLHSLLAPTSSGPAMSVGTYGPATFISATFDFSPLPIAHETVEISTSPEVQTWLAIGDAIPIGPRAADPGLAVVTTTLPSINQRARAARAGAFSENVQVFVG